MDTQIKVIEPSHLSVDELYAIKEETNQIIESILESPQDVSLFRTIADIGKDATTTNTTSISLIEEKIDGDSFDNSDLDMSLTQIKSELDLINPSVVSGTKQEFKKKLLWIIPWTVKRLPKSDEIMSLINKRKDSVKDTIEGLQEHLWVECDKSIKNSVELALINSKLEASESDLQEAIFQGSYIWDVLSEELSLETDDDRKEALQRIINDVATSVVDLKTTLMLNAQARKGASNLIHNAAGIEKLVSRINNVLLPSVANILMVKAAAQQQQNIVNMGNAIMQSASNTIRDTAREVNQTIVDTARMNSSAMIQLDVIRESCQDFENTRVELLNIMKDTEANARQVSKELTNMQESLAGNITHDTKERLTHED